MDLAGSNQANSPRIPPPGSGPEAVRITAYAVLGITGLWLLVSGALVDIEYYDGLSAICNAAYFLGRSTFYFFDRGPLMAWMQLPAEAVKEGLALHPLEVRPHHMTMAIVHGGYLFAVYRVLVKQFGRQWSTLAAFTSAVTSYMFFSYAPFISHDLFPGVLFLFMVIKSEQFARQPRVVPWLLLVGAGTLAPLVKQTYGVFWIAVVAAQFAPTLMRLEPQHRTSRRALMWLVAGAAASGLLTWVIYAVVLSTWAPDAGFWVRPWRNLQYLAHIYDGTDATFPVWIYVRNFWAYGRLTTLLLIPGLVLSLTGARLQRRIALAWIVAIVFMQALPLREVRYIAFLAPLSAFMIAPAAGVLQRSTLGSLLIVVLLALDVSGSTAAAAQIGKRFYRQSELKTFLEPLTVDGRLTGPLFYNVSMLSFVAPGRTPLAADRYHRIFHAGVNQIGVLYRYPPNAVRVVLPNQLPALSGTAPDGTIVLFASGILAHGPSWVPAAPVGSESFAQLLARLETIVLSRRSDGLYQRSDGTPVGVQTHRSDAQADLVIDGAGLRENNQRFWMPVAVLRGNDVHPLLQDPAGRFILAGPRGSIVFAPPDPLVIRSLMIQRLSGARVESTSAR